MTDNRKHGTLKRIWTWLREFDEAINVTETDHLRREIKTLKSEVESLRNRRFDQ
ncbi:MAG: hypothetical protein AAF709_20605 [Pseudomonadota bacterium]